MHHSQSPSCLLIILRFDLHSTQNKPLGFPNCPRSPRRAKPPAFPSPVSRHVAAASGFSAAGKSHFLRSCLKSPAPFGGSMRCILPPYSPALSAHPSGTTPRPLERPVNRVLALTVHERNFPELC